MPSKADEPKKRKIPRRVFEWQTNDYAKSTPAPRARRHTLAIFVGAKIIAFATKNDNDPLTPYREKTHIYQRKYDIIRGKHRRENEHTTTRRADGGRVHLQAAEHRSAREKAR